MRKLIFKLNYEYEGLLTVDDVGGLLKPPPREKMKWSYKVSTGDIEIEGEVWTMTADPSEIIKKIKEKIKKQVMYFLKEV